MADKPKELTPTKVFEMIRDKNPKFRKKEFFAFLLRVKLKVAESAYEKGHSTGYSDGYASRKRSHPGVRDNY